MSQIADLANEDTPQMYTLCGRGPRSSLRVLRHGLEVITCVDVIKDPTTPGPCCYFTLRSSKDPTTPGPCCYFTLWNIWQLCWL